MPASSIFQTVAVDRRMAGDGTQQPDTLKSTPVAGFEECG